MHPPSQSSTMPLPIHSSLFILKDSSPSLLKGSSDHIQIICGLTLSSKQFVKKPIVVFSMEVMLGKTSSAACYTLLQTFLPKHICVTSTHSHPQNCPIFIKPGLEVTLLLQSRNYFFLL